MMKTVHKMEMERKKPYMKKRYLTFDSINAELKKTYRNYQSTKNLDGEKREKYIGYLTKVLEDALTSVTFVATQYLPEVDTTYYKYVALSPFFEGLLKIILIREKYDYFFENYIDNKGKIKITLGDLKEEINKLLKTRKIDKNKHKRVIDVITFIQEQRNNFLHFPLQWHETVGVDYEMYSVILYLCNLFELNFSKEVIEGLKEAIEKNKPTGGLLRFEDVGL